MDQIQCINKNKRQHTAKSQKLSQIYFEIIGMLDKDYQIYIYKMINTLKIIYWAGKWGSQCDTQMRHSTIWVKMQLIDIMKKNEILAIKISIKVMNYIKRFPKCDTS